MIKVGTITGVTASLRWFYHQAATLRDWTVTRIEGGHGWTLSATVVSHDTLRVSQRPLVFETTNDTGVWRWPVTELQITGVSLTATLGRKEQNP